MYKKTLFIFTLLLTTTSVSAAPPLTKYTPGETIDPNCSPGQTNCDIEVIQGDSTDDAFIDNPTENRVELTSKSDGTPRDAGTEFVVTDEGRVTIGTQKDKARVNVESSDAQGGGLFIENLEDNPFLKVIILRAGLTETQKRYFEFQDYAGVPTNRMGANKEDSIILFKTKGGVGGTGYHPLFAGGLENGGSGLTRINSAKAVFVNQEGAQTGDGGLVVWDGTSNGSDTIANKYGTVNSLGVQSHNGREIRAFAVGDQNYTRMLTTGTGYVDSTQPLSIRSAANVINFVDSAYATQVHINTANGKVGIGTTVPERKLHISDAMRLEPIASAPTGPSSGDIYFDDSEALCVYVDNAWSKISGSGTCN